MWSIDIRRGCTCTLTILSCMTAVDLMMCRACEVRCQAVSLMSHSGATGCESRRLQLNTDKTEVIWFGSTANLNKLHSQEHHIQISSEIIIPTSVVRDLGVQLDSELSMKQHIRKVAATCFFFQFRRLRHRRVGQELTLHLVLAYVITRLDYCNSLLAGLPLSLFEPLQRVQNAAARL